MMFFCGALRFSIGLKDFRIGDFQPEADAAAGG